MRIYVVLTRQTMFCFVYFVLAYLFKVLILRRLAFTCMLQFRVPHRALVELE